MITSAAFITLVTVAVFPLPKTSTLSKNLALEAEIGKTLFNFAILKLISCL